MSPHPPRRIVSVTPLPLERDSRTLKIAISFARWGYESIVVENRPSAHDAKVEWETLHGIKVITLPGGNVGLAAGSTGPARQTHESDSFSDLRRRVFKRIPKPVAEVLHYFLFRTIYQIIRPLLHAKYIPSADIYYLHEYRLFPMLRRRIRGKKHTALFYDAHDFYSEVETRGSESWVTRRIFRPFLEKLERRCVAAADTVITVSGGVRDLMEAFFGRDVYVIRNCHDKRLDFTVAGSCKSRLGLDEKSFLMVTVGNRKPGFAVDTILAALANLPAHVHVVFIGRYHEPTKVAAIAAGLDGRVHLLGGVHPNEIVPSINGADLALVPYVAVTRNVESILPNGFFQSASANIPLVLPILRDIEESVGSLGLCWWTDFSKAEELTATLECFFAEYGEIDERQGTLAELSSALSWEREETKLQALVSDKLSRITRNQGQ